MRKAPESVISISVGRLPRPSVRSTRVALRRAPARPVRALVVDRTATERSRICEAGRQAGFQSQWIEAVDSTAAAQMMESGEIDFVVADSLLLEECLDWLRSGSAAGRRGPLIVILSDDQQPLRIQQMLDAGADCLLSKHLPQSLLESELRELVAQSAKRLADPVQSPFTFPNGSHS